MAYSDDYMYYDEKSGKYVLTEKDLIENLGLDLRARLSVSACVAPEVVLNRTLKLVSDMVYAFIFKYNARNDRQKSIIAAFDGARDILRRAMEYQLLYVCTVGNLMYSVKPDERTKAMDELAVSVLNEVIPETGYSILYTGGLYG